MHPLTITLVATIALFASAANSQAVGGGPGPSPGQRPNRPNRPHRVFHGQHISKTGKGAPAAQNVKAPGASISAAGQAAAGGNANPLISTKKKTE